jgi:hypothetical protein
MDAQSSIVGLVPVKNCICVVNAFLGIVALTSYGELASKAVLGLLIASLGPIAWNEWLHRELFVSKDGRTYLSQASFNIIGLVSVVGVLLVILHSLLVHP